MKNCIRVAICVILVVAVLAMSLSVFAFDEGDRIVSAEYLWAYYIYQFLHSVGIDVTYRGIIEYTNEVQDTIIDWVIAYIADLIEADSQPSNYSIAQWVAPWQAGYDYWGNLQFNSTMLEDMQDFAEWLKRKLSLVDDSTIIVNPVVTVNGYNVYQFDKFYSCTRLEGEEPNYVAIRSSQVTGNAPLGYFVATWYGANNTVRTYYVLLSRLNNGAGSYYIEGLSNDTSITTLQSVGYSSNGWIRNSNDVYYYETLAYDGTGNALIPDGNNLVAESYSVYETFMQNFVIQEQGNVQVVTASIVFPVENPDYTQGDGMTIIDGVPQYDEITFSGVVENLPAIVSTGTVTNPSLETFWGFIPVLAEQTKDAIVLTRGLIYELPEEVVVTFYAVMGGLILFGIIKLMREH